MEKIEKIKDLIWEFDNGSQNAFEVIQKIKEVCNHNDEADKPKMRYKSNMKYFEVVQSILKSYHDAMDDKNSDLTCVPKMYVNKDYWVTKISVPYDMLGNRIDIELDDRTDTDYWGSLFYDEKSRDGIDFCVYQPEDSDGTPSLYLYPVADGDIDVSKEFQIECEIINNF